MAAAVVGLSAESLARKVVAVLAPEELASFDAVAAPYLTGPRRAERRWLREHDDPMGFGPGDAVALVTPVVALVSGAVVTALSEGIAESVRSRAGLLLRRMTARLRRGERPDEAAALEAPRPPQWTTAQLAEARRVALGKALGLGLEPARAEALADAVVGELVRLHDEQR